MDCTLMESLIQDYLDDELNEELRDQVRSHLIWCRRCAWELESIRQVLSALRESALPAAANPDFRDRLLVHLLRDHRAAVAGRAYAAGLEPLPRRRQAAFVLDLTVEEGEDEDRESS